MQNMFQIYFIYLFTNGHSCNAIKSVINEPPPEKTNNVVSEQVGHKPSCISTEKS